MTPAERARLIDRNEFAAECAAIRKRAFAMLKRKRPRDPRVEQWIKRGDEAAVTHFKPSPVVLPVHSLSPNARRPAVMYEAFGKAQSLGQWAREYGLVTGTIRTRLKLGWPLEDALRKPPNQMGKRAHRPRPGVVLDFVLSEGTGAGSTSQETPNITFSGNDA